MLDEMRVRIQALAGRGKVPGLGTILVGDTLADEALLSGESRPVQRPVGSQVMGLWPKGQVPVRLSTTTAGLRAVVRVLE